MASTNGTPNVFSLPNEILVQIASYFILPDLQCLAASSRQFYAVCTPRLQDHLALHRRYRHLTSNETQRFGWLEPLTAILRGHVPAEYVEKISFSRCEFHYHDLNLNRGRGPVEPSADDIALVRQAAKESPWITDHDACGPRANAVDMDHFIEEIVEGDQDNILAVLVPLLPNLKGIYFTPNDRFDIGGGGDQNTLGFGSLPQILHRIGVASTGLDRPLALPALVEIRGSSLETCLFDDWLPYMLALPSLKTLEVPLEYGWSTHTHTPPNTPKSNISKLILHGLPCDRTLLEDLAKWIKGPCSVIHNPIVPHLGNAEAFAMRWRSCILRDGKIEDVEMHDGASRSDDDQALRYWRTQLDLGTANTVQLSSAMDAFYRSRRDLAHVGDIVDFDDDDDDHDEDYETSDTFEGSEWDTVSEDGDDGQPDEFHDALASSDETQAASRPDTV